MKSNKTDFLSLESLAKLSNYNLIARIAVDSFLSGLHKSVNHGFGSEFFQFRNYTPGDELKYIDWKVFAKTDKYYSKVFYEETNFNCNIILDSSASLAYQGTKTNYSKFKYSAMIAASLAYIANMQGDNTSLLSYNDQNQVFIPPGNRGSHINRLLTSISSIKPTGKACHEKYLHYLVNSIRRKGVIIIISDFIDKSTNFPELFKKLGFPAHDCIAIQVLDNDELELPFKSTKRFIDSETNQQILTAPKSIREDYKKSISTYIENFKNSCLDIGIDYLLCKTDQDLTQVLSKYLNCKASNRK